MKFSVSSNNDRENAQLVGTKDVDLSKVVKGDGRLYLGMTASTRNPEGNPTNDYLAVSCFYVDNN